MTGLSNEAASQGAKSITINSYALINRKLGGMVEKALQKGSISGWSVSKIGEGVDAIYSFTKKL